jgi:predicted XRE-type DNA-binding protein
MSNEIKFEKSSGNVFRDLDLPDAEELFIKATLGFEVFQIIEERHLTQKEVANLLGVKQPEISRLKKGKFNHYSVARLMKFLNRLNRDIEIRIIPSKDGQRAKKEPNTVASGPFAKEN